MDKNFAETLRKLRTEKGLSQREMAERLYVTRSTIAKWESGDRMPDAAMISRLSSCLEVPVDTLLCLAAQSIEVITVIMVDDSKIVLTGGLPVLEQTLPNAIVIGFTRPSEAVEYARSNRIDLAFLDIEMGKICGLDLCDQLIDINPQTNVVFLTAYGEYSLDAWRTKASGFMLKPITPEGVRNQLKNLRYPLFSRREKK